MKIIYLKIKSNKICLQSKSLSQSLVNLNQFHSFRYLKEKIEEEKKEEENENDDQKLVFKSKLARNIYRAAFKPELPKYNELFFPRRMAYVIDLEDEETDIPVTLTR